MDYEKNATMNREEAINVVRNIYQTDKEKEALSILIPELAESEDERIRKALIHLISEQDGILTAINGISVKDILAYLEKHKERNALSTEEIELNSLAFLEQMGYTCLPPGKEHPTEWSDEDKENLKDVIATMRSKYEDTIYGAELENWLKLLPERFNLQPKQEWSEGDEKMVGRLRSVIRECASYNCALDVNGDYCEGDYAKLDDWLKSLRPSWKPSEEQMNALWNTLHPDDPYYVDLSSLYDNLKKL